MFDTSTRAPAPGKQWETGQQIFYNFWRLDGSLGTVHPARVLSDDGRRLLCWVIAGT